MDVGSVIKKARQNKGMTQQELADLVGVQKSAVAKWEKGRVSEIKRSNLAGLAYALDLKPYELFNTNIKENPEDTANKVADYLLDSDVMNMIDAYSNLDTDQRKQVMEFIQFLSAKA